MNINKILGAVAVSATTLVAQPAHAEYVFGFSIFNSGNSLTLNGTTTLPNIDSGWYGANDFHEPGNTNYIACLSNCGTAIPPSSNFFVFDISSLTSPVTSAAFTVFSYDVLGSSTYTLFDYTGSIASLTAGTDTNANEDLSSGIAFGSRAYAEGDDDMFHTIALNAAFLADLNAAIVAGDSLFAFGGTIAQVPEPISLALVGLGLAGLGWSTRRRALSA